MKASIADSVRISCLTLASRAQTVDIIEKNGGKIREELEDDDVLYIFGDCSQLILLFEGARLQQWKSAGVNSDLSSKLASIYSAYTQLNTQLNQALLRDVSDYQPVDIGFKFFQDRDPSELKQEEIDQIKKRMDGQLRLAGLAALHDSLGISEYDLLA